MPSLDHEVLLLLFRNRPRLAAELLHAALGQQLPCFDAIELSESDLSQLLPTAYHADLVLVLRQGDPVLGIIVEVQLGRDPDKRFSWPLYVSALRARLRCPCCVLVVAGDEGVARWARQPLSLGPGASVFAPLVLSPASIPRVTDTEAARSAPELAVLSAHAHAEAPDGLPVLLAALEATADLERDRGMLYWDVIWRAAGESLRGQLEQLMQTGSYTYQSDFAKRYLAAGKAEGKAEGRIEALLAIAAARQLELTDEQETLLRSCQDLQQLDEWIRRAARAHHAHEVFTERR